MILSGDEKAISTLDQAGTDNAAVCQWKLVPTSEHGLSVSGTPFRAYVSGARRRSTAGCVWSGLAVHCCLRPRSLHTDYLAFLSQEIARMPAEVVDRLLASDLRARQYRSFIERLRQRGAYLLPDDTEKALGARRPWTTPDIAVKAYRKQLSSAAFRLDSNSKELSYTEVRALLRSPSQETRHRAQAAVKR